MHTFTRRDLLGLVASVGLGAIVPWPVADSSSTPLSIGCVPRFVTPLPVFAGRRVAESPLLIGTCEFQQRILPDQCYARFPAPFNSGTYLWGYAIGSGAEPHYPGVTVEARAGAVTRVMYRNEVPLASTIQRGASKDARGFWADPLRQPDACQLYRGTTRSPFSACQPALSIYDYRNTPGASAFWFGDGAPEAGHDLHSAGLAAMYLIRDEFDTGQVGSPSGLPIDPYEIELVIQHHAFDLRGQFLPLDTNSQPTSDELVAVNGRTWPFLDVEPRRYRFHVLNASNQRSLRLNLRDSHTRAPGPVVWQIGGPTGLFDTPTRMSDTLGPGESADLIIDFAETRGRTLTLTNERVDVMQFRVTQRIMGRDVSYDPASREILRPRSHLGW